MTDENSRGDGRKTSRRDNIYSAGVDQDLADKIEAFRTPREISKSEAVRRLLRDGVERQERDTSFEEAVEQREAYKAKILGIRRFYTVLTLFSFLGFAGLYLATDVSTSLAIFTAVYMATVAFSSTGVLDPLIDRFTG
jgi:hypothetical protein